ncbi:MAG: histidine triad nucleotide-binding protein [Bacillota bacterium]|nr:MAG: histidine triad nucleotide-binding protein [Bacillota bacterium]
MQDCIFCKIVRGELPSAKVYEDDLVLAFKDINPQAPVHVLVIPKAHYASVMELPAQDGQLLSRLFSAIQQVARELGVAETGFRLVANTGPDSGQMVPHLHFHILGGRKMGHGMA